MKVFKIDADTIRHLHSFVFMRIKKKAAEPRCLLSVSSKLKQDPLLLILPVLSRSKKKRQKPLRFLAFCKRTITTRMASHPRM